MALSTIFVKHSYCARSALQKSPPGAAPAEFLDRDELVLVVPLNIAEHLIRALSFRFTERREFDPEEIEIARALESQAALAIQVTRLAKAAKQAAILEERARLAGEIHDGLAQSFTAICMQLGVAEQELSSKEGNPNFTC